MDSSRSYITSRRDFLRTLGAASVVGVTLKGSLAWATTEGLPGFAFSAEEFAVPPDAARPWVYWWWLEGAVTKESITKDLEALKQQGISGVLLFDAGYGGTLAPKGPVFMTDEWREHFKHSVREATRLGMQISANLSSGWDAGGPWVTEEYASKVLVSSETTIAGGTSIRQSLDRPKLKQPWVYPRSASKPSDWYREVAVVACPMGDANLWQLERAVNLTGNMKGEELQWDAPRGRWSVLRFGCVLSGETAKFSSADFIGWEIDPLSREALDHHFANTAAKLIDDAGPLAGGTLKYVHIDNWELQQPNWTIRFIEEFRQRRGYDMVSYLPALAGKVVTSTETTERFLWDYRRTFADLVRENYYGRLAELAHAHGVQTDCQGGGPFFQHAIDALECQGASDIPEAEFWSNLWGSIPRWPGKDMTSAPVFSNDGQWPGSFGASIRQAASAVHTYGKKFVEGEAFTNFNDDWTEDPDALKPYGDRALCQGLTRNLLHHFLAQSGEEGPGYFWEHVGTNLSRHLTWWSKSHAWLDYLARCQYMLAQGTFVADVLYYAGEALPNFVLTDRKPTPGFDFDAINAEALLTRTRVKDGKVVLSDGQTYRYLVIPDPAGSAMSPAVLHHLIRLVEDGATLVASRPVRGLGLRDHQKADGEVRALADRLWGKEGAPNERRVGRGRIVGDKPLAQLLVADSLLPDVDLQDQGRGKFDWIHRREGSRDIYFIANLGDEEIALDAIFRVTGKAPEVWDPVTGKTRGLGEFNDTGGRTSVPLRFAPRQSFFVVFGPSNIRPAQSTNFPAFRAIGVLEGAWEVSFDSTSMTPRTVRFEELMDWTHRPETDIRHFSGTAVYRKTFQLPQAPAVPMLLDLGTVKNLAQVRVNGRDLGVVWTAPWRVDITEAIQEGNNALEIEVVNLWPNRMIAEGKLPREKRRTRTNVRTYEAVLPEDLMDFGCPVCEQRKKTGAPRELLPSGLLGPITLGTTAPLRVPS